MKVSIIGCGHVGSAMAQLLPQAIKYDSILGIGKRDDVMGSYIAFLCLPTPSAADGSCDTSIVESVLSWLESDYIVIRSTVPVGFTEKMRVKFNRSETLLPCQDHTPEAFPSWFRRRPVSDPESALGHSGNHCPGFGIYEWPD